MSSRAGHCRGQTQIRRCQPCRLRPRPRLRLPPWVPGGCRTRGRPLAGSRGRPRLLSRILRQRQAPHLGAAPAAAAQGGGQASRAPGAGPDGSLTTGGSRSPPRFTALRAPRAAARRPRPCVAPPRSPGPAFKLGARRKVRKPRPRFQNRMETSVPADGRPSCPPRGPLPRPNANNRDAARGRPPRPAPADPRRPRAHPL